MVAELTLDKSMWQDLMAKNCCGGKQSISIPAVEDEQKGHGNDLQIEGEAPVAKIVQVIFHTLFDRSVPAPAVYLCPAGDSNLERVAEVIALDFLQEPLHKMCSFRSRIVGAGPTRISFLAASYPHGAKL